tara:strand:- start:355 stop:615 length:261 start_codon:yes stop_codon:yes gene_type:complete
MEQYENDTNLDILPFIGDWEEMGKGVHVHLKDGILNIVVDTTKDYGLSASGKSTIIATSSGNKKINIGSEVEGDQFAFLGLNLYRK